MARYGRVVAGCAVRLAAACAATGAMALAGCTAIAQDGGNPLRNFLLYGGPTVPPSAEVAPEDVYCPRVGVLEGGSVIQAGAGQMGSPRRQIALGELARECRGRPDGSTEVKIGVEGRALASVAGASGRFDVPVHFVVRQGGKILADRVRRTSVVIPPGESQGSFALVEEGIVVPPASAQSFEIEVGLGGGAPRARGRS
jgi:hypothetical protein